MFNQGSTGPLELGNTRFEKTQTNSPRGRKSFAVIPKYDWGKKVNQANIKSFTFSCRWKLYT